MSEENIAGEAGTPMDALLLELRAMRESLQSLQAENATLRQQVTSQTTAAAHHQARHAALNPQHAVPGSELMVGIRNVSDNTVGIPGFPKGTPDVTLNPGLPGEDNSTAIISYVHWLRLRNSDYTRKGRIIRDDSVLGIAFTPAPADLPVDIPEEAARNTIVDPVAWIAERDDEQLARDIDAITSPDTLRRLRGVVDRWLYDYQVKQSEPFSEKTAKQAISRLPSKLVKVDELTTAKLEPQDADTGPVANIKLTPADIQRMRTNLRMG